MEITKTSDILAERLGVIRRTNPRYSLRAFARDLKIDPGFLSHLLNGNRRLSLSKAAQLAHELRLDGRTRKLFLLLAELESADSPKHREDLLSSIAHLERAGKAQTIPLDQFAIISDWYHYAILEMAESPGFDPTPAKIAERLGIPVLEAKFALQRLIKLNLLQQKGATLSKTTTQVTAPENIRSVAIRKRHSQILQKAKEALDSHPVDQREFQSITMCIDPKQMEWAKKKIREFAWSLCRSLESKGARKEVHELSIQFFSLEKSNIQKPQRKSGSGS